MHWQHTLQHKLTLSGVGLHTGCRVQCELLPQTSNTGIMFVRTDVPAQPEVAASVHSLCDTTLATTLGVQHAGSEVRVGTVEHLLSALRSLGVDNVRVLLDGPEVPVLDGSALPWVQAILEVGLQQQAAPRTYLRVREEVTVRSGHKWARLSPHRGLSVHCTLDYDHPLIPQTTYRYNAAPQRFVAQLAAARTFCFREEIDALQARGLARGGSLDNAIVIDGYQVLNPAGLRFPDECLRHKVLDALGDLSLMGAPVLGRMELHCSGHALNTELVRAALADPRCLERVTLNDQGAPQVMRPQSSPSSQEADGMAGTCSSGDNSLAGMA